MNPRGDQLNKVIDYYNDYDERARLSSVLGQIEFERTKTIIARYLIPPPAVVLDVGGAAGGYSAWLAGEGYTVHLIDPVPRYVEQAKQASDNQPETPIASCTVGDARQLEFDGEIADAVLLLGPVYHLVEAKDRHRALKETQRVLRPGGYLFTAAISRFASTIDGLVSGYYLDPTFREIMREDLENGQHRNPTHHPKYFMDSFFHHPDGLVAEVSHAGFEVEGIFAVEGISYLMKDIQQSWKSDEYRKFLLEILSILEQEPVLLGASPHLLCVGSKGIK